MSHHLTGYKKLEGEWLFGLLNLEDEATQSFTMLVIIYQSTQQNKSPFFKNTIVRNFNNFKPITNSSLSVQHIFIIYYQCIIITYFTHVTASVAYGKKLISTRLW
jgi:hypothetical protein